jgi:redox-sensitive bicupin YhaK (pirin superfamily)
MTAASGILHKEYHEKEFTKTGGTFQMVQHWVNLQSKHKMSKPKYQPLTQSQMGKYELPGNGGIVEIIAGEFNGEKGPAFTFSPMQMYNIRIKKSASFEFNLPENYNTSILVIEGSVKINETDIAPADNFILFNNDGESISILADEESVLLVMSGEPIDEPIAAYGPFLMNTESEIMEAYNDLNKGKFGFLED